MIVASSMVKFQAAHAWLDLTVIAIQTHREATLSSVLSCECKPNSRKKVIFCLLTLNFHYQLQINGRTKLQPLKLVIERSSSVFEA